MLWIKALHVFFMVTWFAGLFYLPRLFVYHAMCRDEISNDRFKIMERKLFYGIMAPGAILTIVFGAWTMSFDADAYMHSLWMNIKLGVVMVLIFYHLYLGKLLHNFKHDRNTHSDTFYRWLNEAPVLLLAAIIILVIVKPWGTV